MTTIFDILSTVGSEAIVGTASAIVAWAVSRRRKANQEVEAIKYGLHTILRNSIIKSNADYSKRGWISIQEKDALLACYAAYHNLGTNGVIDDIMTNIRRLPTTPPKS